MRVADMDALTLRALARELEREARSYGAGTAHAAVLSKRAALYRRRAKLADGGWAVVDRMVKKAGQ